MKKRILICSCLIFIFAGCAGTKEYVFYDGPQQPKEKIAFLYAEPGSDFRLFQINEHKSEDVNGFGSRRNDSFVMELLPGEYTLQVGYREYYGTMIFYSTENRIVTFKARAGHVYQLTGETSKSAKGIWAIPKVIDVTPEDDKPKNAEYTF